MMNSTSLDKLDEYIRELEAVRNYGKVHKEKDDAIRRGDELLTINEGLNERLEHLSDERDNLSGQLREGESKLQAMAHTLADKEKECIYLREREERLKGLSAMLDGKSIKQLPKSMEVEIQGIVEERYRIMKDDWEKAMKPKEVSEQAIKQLKLIILGLKLPKWVRKYYPDPEVQVLSERIEEEIMIDTNKRIDDEFNVRVEMETNRRVSEMLERMKEAELTKLLSETIRIRASELESKIKSKDFSALVGPWTLECDKCHMNQEKELPPELVEALLREGSVKVGCSNIFCKDTEGVQHTIMIDLITVISNYIKGTTKAQSL